MGPARSASGGGGQKQRASAREREGRLFSQPISAPPPPNSRTVLRRVASLVPRPLISCVSYLYVVMLMNNSCGADGPGVNRSQSLWISLPITHLAPVAISPRALWWRRPPRRPLGAGAFGFFPGFECHLSVWPTNAPRPPPPLARHSSASPAPELGLFTFAPSHPPHPSRRSPPSRTPAPQPPASEEAGLSFLGITFTLLWAPDEKNSPSRLWVSKQSGNSGRGPSHHFLAKHPASWRRNPPKSARTPPGRG